MDGGELVQRCDLMRRCAFDAMACIKALEVRLVRQMDRAQANQLIGPFRSAGANDA